MALSTLPVGADRAPGAIRNGIRRRTAPWPAIVAATGVVSFLLASARILDASAQRLFGYMADDAFYYLDIARRFPHLGTAPGFSTTGFHPLYWLLLVPVVHVLPGDNGLRAALVLLLACHLGAGWMLFRLLRRRWSPSVAGAVAIFWMVSPLLQAIVLLGLETALVEVTVLGVLLACDPAARATTRRCLVVGAALGAAYWARNDSVVVCLPVVGTWMWCRRRELRQLRRAAVAPLAAAVVAAPWVTVLLAHGSVLSDSARALPTLAVRQQGTGAIAHTTVSAVFGLIVALAGTDAGTLVPVVVAVSVVVSAGIVWAVCRGWTPVDTALVVSVPVLFVLYVLALRGIREWYFVFVAIWIFVLVLPPLADMVFRAFRPLTARWPAVVGALGLVLVAVLVIGGPARTPGEVDKFQAALAAARIVPTGTRVASFDSGVYQWVLKDDVVVNLDGVVNPAATPYGEQHRLCRYLAAGRVSWFIDQSVRQLTAHEPGIEVRSTWVLVPGIDGHVPQVLVRFVIAGCPSR